MSTSCGFAKRLYGIYLKKYHSADFLASLVGINFTKVPFFSYLWMN
jgi:hypothetical protein